MPPPSKRKGQQPEAAVASAKKHKSTPAKGTSTKKAAPPAKPVAKPVAKPTKPTAKPTKPTAKPAAKPAKPAAKPAAKPTKPAAKPAAKKASKKAAKVSSEEDEEEEEMSEEEVVVKNKSKASLFDVADSDEDEDEGEEDEGDDNDDFELVPESSTKGMFGGLLNQIGGDEDEGDEGDSDSEDFENEELPVEKASARLAKMQAQVSKDADAELQTNLQSMEKFTLPSGQELEREKMQPPDMAVLNQRIQDVLFVLQDFRTKKESDKSRTDYMALLASDLASYFGILTSYLSYIPS
jgi:ribosomal RNA methyltransferase Nop2